ncbi:MAG: hypothetical protein HY581_02195 [Nitrospirae bacterium]|nr:hypothetical protein [Nitrospirota bacterium]
MEQDGQLSAYREHLLDALRDLPERRRGESSGSLQVFVNQECVGTVDCEGTSTTLLSVSQQQPVREVEIRTAAGLLVGSLSAQEVGMKVARFSLGTEALEVSVQNRSDGGSVRVTYRAPALLWDRVQNMAMAMVRGFGRRGTRVLPEHVSLTPAPSLLLNHAWPKLAVVAQIVLASAVVLLVVDRLTDRFGTESTVAQVAPNSEPSVIKPTILEEALARQEQRLLKLTQTQEAAVQTLKAQQREIGRLHRAVVERERMRDQLQRLTAAKEALSRDVALLEVRNRELEHGLKEQAVALAKVLLPQPPDKPTAGGGSEATLPPPIQPPQMAEVRRENPFTFWVSFQDGTSEESIEHLIHEIHGRRGPTSAGWYNVEVNLPQPQTQDGFFESLKKTKIVKAIATSLNTTPGQ